MPHSPRFVSRRDFTGLDDFKIDQLTLEERTKLDDSSAASAAMSAVESELGDDGTWEQHWINVTDDQRVYASIYYRGDIAVAVTADGHVVQRFRTDK